MTKINKPVSWAELDEERLNEKISRKMIIGKNEMLVRLSLEKGAVVPAHNHVSEQITSVLSGSLVFTIDGREITVKAGEVLVIPPSLVHSVVALEDSIAIDTFSPLREDWFRGDDSYLRTGQSSIKKGS